MNEEEINLDLEEVKEMIMEEYGCNDLVFWHHTVIAMFRQRYGGDLKLWYSFLRRTDLLRKYEAVAHAAIKELVEEGLIIPQHDEDSFGQCYQSAVAVL